MKLSVIIVNYNVKYYIAQCIESLQRALQGIDSEVIVIDNHSQDGSCEYLKEHFPQLTLIENIHNLGFARANNIGIRQSQGEYVLLLNPDTFVAETTLQETLQFMDQHPQAGGLGVKMLNSDGSCAKESRRGIPTPATSFYKMSGLCSHYPQNRRFGKYYMSYLPWDSPQRIEIISGAFCLLRRKALDQTGLLDEDFFMYGEDIDLSYRLLKAGWENWYYPATILHYKGESTYKSSFKYIHVFYQAMLIFFKKHYGQLSLLVTLPVKMAIYAKAFTALVCMMSGRMKKSLGFTDQNTACPPYYIFIGGKEATERCRKIAFRHGLEAEFIAATEDDCPDGHSQLSLNLNHGNRMTIVVYDTDSFRFQTILRCFHMSPDPHVRMGTFVNRHDTIITHYEIIR